MLNYTTFIIKTYIKSGFVTLSVLCNLTKKVPISALAYFFFSFLFPFSSLWMLTGYSGAGLIAASVL